MKDFNKKFGFTLSEVLITLGIIGIVAVLTIPAVMKTTETGFMLPNYKKLMLKFQMQFKQLW